MHFVRSVVFLSILTLCAALPNAEANRYLQYEIHEAFEEYAGNTENGQIRTARRDTAVIRALHPDDRLPGLSQREVRNLVAMGRESGEPFDVWGVRTRYSSTATWRLPPMYRTVYYAHNQFVLGSPFTADGGWGPMERLNLQTGEVTPWEPLGIAYGEVLAIFGHRRDSPLAVRQLDNPELMDVFLFQGSTIVLSLSGLRVPTENTEFLLKGIDRYRISYHDNQGNLVTMAFNHDGEPMGPPIPANWVDLPYGTFDFDVIETMSTSFNPGGAVFRPRHSVESAIPIGTLENTSFPDPTLYLPLDRYLRPIPLPDDARGVVRLPIIANADNQDAAVQHLKARMNPLRIDIRHHQLIHNGWALVRMDGRGQLTYELGAGTASMVVADAEAGLLPRCRTVDIIDPFEVHYFYAPGRGSEPMVAFTPPRALLEETSGQWRVWNLQLGTEYEFFLNTVYDSWTREDIERNLSNSDAFLINGVSGEALHFYAESQREYQAALVRITVERDTRAEEQARRINEANEAIFAMWEAAEEEHRAEQAMMDYYNANASPWDLWRREILSQPETEVVRDRGFIRIIRRN